MLKRVLELLFTTAIDAVEFAVETKTCICDFSAASTDAPILCVVELTPACTVKAKVISLIELEVFVAIFDVTVLPSVNPILDVLGDVLLDTSAVCLGIMVTDEVLFAAEAASAADNLLDTKIEEVVPLVADVICAADFRALDKLPVALAVLPFKDVLALLEAAIEAVVEAVEATTETVALDDTETEDVLAVVEELTDAELLLDNETDDVA